MAIIDLTGRRFERLFVLEYTSTAKNGQTLWKCRCDCGNIKIVRGSHLRGSKIRSCGCLHKEVARELGKRDFLPDGVAASHGLYTAYRKKAESRGYVFEVAFDIFIDITQQRCHYCNQDPAQIRKYKSCKTVFAYNGIDRIDNTKGYIESNIVACCKWCNQAKSTMTYTDFIDWVNRIYSTLSRRGEFDNGRTS